jgi:hypothetical protein
VQEICAPVAHRHVVFTIPRALRGLFRRDRKLLGLLARCAWDALVRSVRACLGDRRLRPGAVLALQTFGAYAANFHPHVHALVTDGAFAPDGTFHELPGLDPRLLEELFRRLVLQRLHAAGRLSEEFRDNLLSWRRSGFSVGADQRIEAGDLPRLERLARYIARGPLPLDRVRVEGGQVLVTTPPDPRTGATELALDPLDFVHAVTEQIPDPGQHLVRYYGWYASRTRGRRRAAHQPVPSESTAAAVTRAPPARGRRQSWARMLRRILETDPLLCPRCGAQLKLLAVLTDPDVVFRIARRIEAGGGDDPFEARAPPAPPAQTG